jgi:hypothetical protein
MNNKRMLRRVQEGQSLAQDEEDVAIAALLYELQGEPTVLLKPSVWSEERRSQECHWHRKKA